jgi:glycosyltransferase involved in cell wall biosynthesis
LYEAGNGPGMDAWEMGVPVAMSKIASFIEHLQIQGLHAETFDPRNPSEIAEKIDRIISNPEYTENNVKKSLEAIKKITWEDTAKKYIKIFEDSIKNNK